MFVVAPTKKTFPQYARYSKLIVLQVKCNETKIETFYSTQISTLFCILFIKRTGNLLSYYYLEKIFLLNKYRHSYLFCFFFNRVPFLLLHELFKMETTFNLLFVCRQNLSLVFFSIVFYTYIKFLCHNVILSIVEKN